MKLQSARGWLLPAFLACVFYGDVYIGITVPLSIFVLPGVYVAYRLDRQTGNSVWPAGLFMLVGMGLIVGLQALSGHALDGRGDAVVYLSIFYAAATLFICRGLDISDKALRLGIIGGALMTGAVMCVMIAAAPKDAQLVASQYLPGKESYAEYLERRGRAAEAVASSKRPDIGLRFSPPADAASYEMYDVKRLARNALGFSNYISAFLVFGFTVALFSGSKWAAGALALLVFSTLSRFGMVFLGLAVALWFAHRKGIDRNKAAAGVILCVAVGICAAAMLKAPIAEVPRLASLSARIEYWKSGLEVLGEQPLIGRPRSDFMDTFGLSVLWNPHNSLLWVGALFGLLGIAIYAGYQLLLLRSVSARSAASPVWTGVFFGCTLLIAWSLIEQLALSPAFELLLAAVYALSARRDTA